MAGEGGDGMGMRARWQLLGLVGARGMWQGQEFQMGAARGQTGAPRARWDGARWWGGAMGVGHYTGDRVLDRGWDTRQGWGSRQWMVFQTGDGVPDRRWIPAQVGLQTCNDGVLEGDDGVPGRVG